VHPGNFRATVKKSAEKIYYPQCLEYIANNLPDDFHALARATLIYYLPSQIVTLKTKEERRAAIDSIPENADPKHSKELVSQGVRIAWKKRGF